MSVFDVFVSCESRREIPDVLDGHCSAGHHCHMLRTCNIMWHKRRIGNFSLSFSTKSYQEWCSDFLPNELQKRWSVFETSALLSNQRCYTRIQRCKSQSSLFGEVSKESQRVATDKNLGEIWNSTPFWFCVDYCCVFNVARGSLLRNQTKHGRLW